MKQKAFLIDLKGLSLKQIKLLFFEGENPTLTLNFAVWSNDQTHLKNLVANVARFLKRV